MKYSCVLVCVVAQCFHSLAVVQPQAGLEKIVATASDMVMTRTDVLYVPATTAVGDLKPNSTGTLLSSLEMEGRASMLPFPTPALPSIKLVIPKSLENNSSNPVERLMPRAGSTDIFGGLSSVSIPAQIPRRSDHPVSKQGISQTGPISTNKFYANFFLGGQDQSVWTHPYSLIWRDRATGAAGYSGLINWGMAISHVDSYMRGYGPQHTEIPGSPVEFYLNPPGIRSIILSATELNKTTTLSIKNATAMSVNAVLSPQAGSTSRITFPVVQGMGFVTAAYNKLTPLIQSAVFFRDFQPKGEITSGLFKYRVTLNNGITWLLYITPSNGVSPNLTMQNSTQIQGAASFSGSIQVAKIANAADEQVYDSNAGVYATGATLAGSVSGSTGKYSFKWVKAGMKRTLMMFALPHHMQSFDDQTKGAKTSVQLQTTSKGIATAILSDNWGLVEPALPDKISFDPWSPSTGSQSSLSPFAINVTAQVAEAEIAQDIAQISNLNSMYFSGKALSKYATILYTAKYLLKRNDLVQQGLPKLKEAFNRFVSNQQQVPLAYDTKWCGIVSSAWSEGADFGNTWYNDHHFHYGYFVHAAAVIGNIDPQWIANGTNSAWVNSLVKDAGNPSSSDSQFPFSRAFDWYHGHSWAKGLFESPDGKDEESSSEDTFFAYAVKMWGKTTQDASMEARGNLMLAILARSLDNYFLMTSSNVNQPSNFIANKAPGILFENKVDHKTYFGAVIEYIEGIHMLPLAPSSAYTRSQTFIKEEWTAYFTNSSVDPASKVQGGWKGILYGNLACIDPKVAWDFFAQPKFDPGWIDGGASRTWYLAFAAALGGI